MNFSAEQIVQQSSILYYDTVNQWMTVQTQVPLNMAVIHLRSLSAYTTVTKTSSSRTLKEHNLDYLLNMRVEQASVVDAKHIVRPFAVQLLQIHYVTKITDGYRYIAEMLQYCKL